MVRDRDLWRRAVADVVPLRGRRGSPAPSPPAPPPPPLPAPVAPPDLPAPAGRRLTPAPAAARHKPPLLEAGVAVDIDIRSVERLKRGRMAIDGRIDLHGMTQAEAHSALQGFVASAVAGGRRCVLVITGRGAWGEERATRGVLRRMVPRWLNEPQIRPHVLAFTEAHPKDGGAGALYLLLRRRR
jgi:DNA-nicking Smr family endonuclease